MLSLFGEKTRQQCLDGFGGHGANASLDNLNRHPARCREHGGLKLWIGCNRHNKFYQLMRTSVISRAPILNVPTFCGERLMQRLFSAVMEFQRAR